MRAPGMPPNLRQQIVWAGIPPRPDEQRRTPIPDFAAYWSVTGPLIDRFRLHVCGMEGQWQAGVTASSSIAWPDVGYSSRTGETALIAVCNLVLAMKADGKLPEVKP
jgi:hypothetical protein